MRVNTVTMVLTGIVAWVIALVVVLVLRAAGTDVADGVARVCLAGVVLGVVALGWAIPQHRRTLRAERAPSRAEAGDHGNVQEHRP